MAHQGQFVPLDEKIAEHERRFEAHDVDEVGLEASEGAHERRFVQLELCLVPIKLRLVQIKPFEDENNPSLVRDKVSLMPANFFIERDKPSLSLVKLSLSTNQPSLMRDKLSLMRVDSNKGGDRPSLSRLKVSDGGHKGCFERLD